MKFNKFSFKGSTSDIEDCDDLETSLNDPKIKEHNLGGKDFLKTSSQ